MTAFRDELFDHWNDLVDPDLSMINFHAQFFAVSSSPRLADVSVMVLRTDMLHSPVDMILLLPPAAVSRLGNPYVLFPPSSDQLAQRNAGGAHHSELEVLEAVAEDITSGSVLAAPIAHSGAQMSKALVEAYIERHAALRIILPSLEPFVWSLEQFRLHMGPNTVTTDSGYCICVNSRRKVLTEYRSALILADGNDNGHLSPTTDLVEHVCFI